MNFLLILTIFFLVAVLLLILFVREETKGENIYSFVLDQTIRKNKNKVKILELFAAKTRSTSSGQAELTNADIREALGISAASVVRYMDELEKEGRVEQFGDTGRGVAYHLKNTSAG